MKKLLLIIALTSMVEARYSDVCRKKILIARALYAERCKKIKEKTEGETDITKATLRIENLARAQRAELYEESLAKWEDKCCFGKMLFKPSEPEGYDLDQHCWDKLNDVCYETDNK